jgi:radical SAM protein with 4Fe4S-binding SPASM domain
MIKLKYNFNGDLSGKKMSEYVRKEPSLQIPIKSRLFQLDIELTERCNNNCIHCCINLPEKENPSSLKEMTTDEVKEYLVQAANLGCMKVRFTGGEPLLRKDFEELYIFTRKLGMKVLIFTNARLITKSIAELLVKIPPMIPLEITVYGMHKSSYEAITRSPGSFNQFWQGLTLLSEYKIPFIVKSVILPPNKQEIDEFETWSKTLPGNNSNPGYAMFFDLRNRRDNKPKNNLIRKLRVTPEEGLQILLKDKEEYIHTMKQFTQNFMRPSGDQLFPCGAGQSLSVDSYGNIQPCMGVRDPELVQKQGSTLSDALVKFKQLKEIKATNPEYLSRCARCFLMGLCEQCPAKSWAEHGTLDTPVEYLCEVAHAQAYYLGLLAENEKAWSINSEEYQERIDRVINS